MADEFITCLSDRAVLKVAGDDAETMLQGLVTCNMEKVTADGGGFGALLTPQGKILFDFLIHVKDGAFYFDTDKELAPALLKRLTMYRLRSKVELEDCSEHLAVFVSNTSADKTADPRTPSLGSRWIGDKADISDDAIAYHDMRIKLGVPELGKDFPTSDIFPHDAMLDALGGVDFKKGCYVGQEVVSRVHHRSTARKRFIIVESDTPLKSGTELMSGDIAIGTIGSVHSSGKIALALTRIDRLEKAENLTVEDAEVSTSLPDYFKDFQETT